MKTFLMALAASSMIAAVPAAPVAAKEKSQRYYTSSNGVRYWQGNDGRYYCKRSNGTTGLIVGAAAGALLGRAIDTRGERATGTILGAAAGALLGKKVAEGPVKCR